MNVIITMAGDGRRFAEAGYTSPKFAVEVNGRPLISWALRSLEHFSDCNWIFVARREHRAASSIAEVCSSSGIDSYTVIELDSPTGGQAETVLCAERALSDTLDPILIYNIDTYVEPRVLTPDLIRGAGWLPAFATTGSHWSFVRCDDKGRVSEVAEKRPISNLATIGLYYFESFDLFQWSLNRCSFSGYREKFVAPLYQELINDGKEVYTSLLTEEAVHALGTPAEVEVFRKLANNH